MSVASWIEDICPNTSSMAESMSPVVSSPIAESAWFVTIVVTLGISKPVTSAVMVTSSGRSISPSSPSVLASPGIATPRAISVLS